MSFNLSLAQKETEDNPNLVKASSTLQTKIDPMTHDPYKVEVTEGGVDINKSKAPAVVIDGPLGHTYTELLNRVLSKESMGAIIAALNDSDENPAVGNSGDPTGYVDLTPNGQVAGTVGNPQGYLYVADGENLPSSELTRVMSRIIEHRNKGIGDIGVALVSTGKLSATAESLIKHATSMGVSVAIRPASADTMISRMLKREKKD